MNQRRTPSGQRPARRPGQPGRGGARGVRGAREPLGRASSGRTAGSGRGGDPSRSANRPAVARRPAAGGAAKRTTAPEPRRFTGRATVLFAVLVALALAYTYPVRLYLSQQSEIARREAALAAQRQRIDELSNEAALWQDPEYVKIEAKRRFYMVEPGETPLIKLDDPTGAARDAGKGSAASGSAASNPWYDTLWSSIQAADDEGQPK